VVLDVLPVGEVGGAAGELLRDLADHPQLLGGEAAAVDAHPHHEVAVVQLLRLQDRGPAAVDAGAALGVEPVPAHPAAQVGAVDGVEAPVGVDRLNACPHIETVVVPLALLVGVQRREMAHRPLALAAVASGLAARRGGRGLGLVRAGSHGDASFGQAGIRSCGAEASCGH